MLYSEEGSCWLQEGLVDGGQHHSSVLLQCQLLPLELHHLLLEDLLLEILQLQLNHVTWWLSGGQP